MSTKLTGIRKATKAERKSRGAEVVFTWEDEQGREHTIYGCTCYESWEQWGAPRDVLSDNCPSIERWRHQGLESMLEVL